jgi:pSer/pThr/pTyr-binding forkhead associated (FHA) protein
MSGSGGAGNTAGWALQFLAGPERGRRLSLPAGMSCTLGRGEEADLRLLDDEISRRHTTIECDGESLWVTDLESKNGTYLDGARLPQRARTRWPDAAVVVLGASRIVAESTVRRAQETGRGVNSLLGPDGVHAVSLLSITATSGPSSPIEVPPELRIAPIHTGARDAGARHSGDRVAEAPLSQPSNVPRWASVDLAAFVWAGLGVFAALLACVWLIFG